MALAMNVTSQETGKSLQPGGDSKDLGLPRYFVGIVGGVAAAVGLVMVVVVLVGLLVWRRRRRRLRRRNRMADAEAAQGRGDIIYDEIAEDKGTKKKKRKKKKGMKTKEKQRGHDADNNNDMVGMELGALDTAPDIITAHDNESIYETLDGRRAARAKAGHVTKDDQSESCNALGNTNPVVSPEFSDATYDHLHRFRKPNFPRLPPEIPEKRMTDPEVTTRPKPPGKPRAVRSADCVTRGGKVRADTAKGNCEDKRVWAARERFGSSPTESPSGSLRSSLTELARQSVSGGKRIVCQLTMVGVVENGKPVPVRPAAASNAYFILESSTDPTELAEEGAPRSPAPKFRIKNEVSTEDEHGGRGGGGSAPAGVSDYFILEPLSQQEDLEDFVDTAFAGVSLSCEDNMNQDDHLSDDSRGSLHSHRSLGSGRDSRKQRRETSFRNTRVKSCPEDCSFTEDADDTLSRKNNYGRSFSSPQSSQYRRSNRKNSSAQIKMDADILNARVRQAMIALFSDDSDEPEQSDVENADETLPEEESENPEAIPCTPRSPRNNYFELESDEAEVDSTEESSTQHPVLPESCGMVDRERSRYNSRRQPLSPSPPPLPKRNGHNRSKSETRTPVVLYGQSSQQSRDQGPVIVSLKKHRALDEDDTGRVEEDPSKDGVAVPDEAFRPRFKSESGVLSERLGRC